MGPEILVVIFIGMSMPAALLGLIVSWWMTHERRSRLEAIWSDYARRRGLTFVPARGEWPNRSAPEVRWSDDDAAFRICASGREGVVATHVFARPVVAVLGEFVLEKTSADARTSGVTGDALIDACFAVRARPEGLARRVLRGDVARALVGFDIGARGSLVYERGEVKLRWAGGEENDARLDEAQKVVRHVVRALRGTTRPAPSEARALVSE